ncbi:MAG: GTPase Era [Pseudomonadota bacterium]|nr:GTPase Era [Pseudomonadota bacterium]
MDSHLETCFGFVVILGEPNAGKSSLVNELTGLKVSIVTHKPQTTRSRIRGIMIQENKQLVLIDTPGVFEPRRKLDKILISAAWTNINDADIIALLVDTKKGISAALKRIITQMKRLIVKDISVILILNKIDTVEREKLLLLTEQLNSYFAFDATFMISATKGWGVKDLSDWLVKSAPSGPWLYPDDQTVDLPSRAFATEITREKLLLRMHNEVPYRLLVQSESWTENGDGSIKIVQNILVSNKRYKSMILGQRGDTIKAISISARRDLEEILSKKIHLFLRVKVSENWFQDAIRFSKLGVDIRG